MENPKYAMIKYQLLAVKRRLNEIDVRKDGFKEYLRLSDEVEQLEKELLVVWRQMNK